MTDTREIITPSPGQPYGCELCDGYGNLITPQGVKDCSCKIRALVKHRLMEARIPLIYTDKTLDNFDPKTAELKKTLVLARQYVEAYRPDLRGLVFMGECGTGKTHLAVSILRELICKGYSGLYYNVINLLDDLRASYDAPPGTRWPILDRVRDTDILVLDDLGAEKTSGWVNDRLYAIINHRYENKKTLIVTTNRSNIELRDQVGNRISSRLAEMCKTVTVIGRDYRELMMRGKF